jgi:hypothetical protein
MKEILKENQKDYTFKLSPEQKFKTGTKFKKLYFFGDTFKLNNQIKKDGDTGKISKDIQKITGNKWSGVTKVGNDFVVYTTLFPNKSTGEYDKDIIEKGKEQFNPYIDKLKAFYKIELSIDKLIDELEDYTPGEKSDNPNAAQVATAEEANEIRRRLENFKERLLNISSSEELQNTMKLMMDVKAGKSKYEFSANNKIAIKTQRPDATIVCNRNNWAKWYNRTVKPDAKPIFVNSASSGGYNSSVTKDFLGKVDASSYKDLSGSQKQELHNLQAKSKYGQARTFAWIAFYDVKDTMPMEGAEDEIGADMERARLAADKLGDKSLSDIGGNAQTTTDEKVIKPVYDGLVAYANAQNLKINQKDGITVSKDVNAGSTKLLSSALLSQILSGKLKGLASRASVEAKSSASRRQQAEVASWQFMDAFGVDYNLADVDMNVIFGAPQGGKSPEEQSKEQKKQIHNVLGDISDAVNHLVDFVNVSIKDNANISEIEGNLPQGKHVSPMDIARNLGISDMLNEDSIKELHERLRRKLNLL